MKIEKIKKQKSGKYKLELDNHESIITYDEVILKYNLLFSKNIDTTLMNEIEKDNDYYEAYYKTLKYIETKMRSKYEIKEYLKRINIEEDKIEKIILDLNKKGFLNDTQYIKAYVSDRIHLSNYGPYKIKEELLKHNFDEEAIDLELSNYDPQIFKDKLQKIIDKKNSLNTKYTAYIWKQKLLTYCQTIGYSKDMILSLLENVTIKNFGLLEKEYQILYRKLSKKYNDYELDSQIKSRLFRKGFSLEEINEYIKNG